MIVDDDPLITTMLSQCLQQMGCCQVSTYNNSHQCLAAFKKQRQSDNPPGVPVDVMIVDWKLPDIDGLTLAQRLKEVSPATEIIMITGYGDMNVAIEAFRMGVHDFFPKPLSLPKLIESIKRTKRYQALLRESDYCAEELPIIGPDSTQCRGSFLGKSEVIRAIIGRIRRLRKDGAPPVLITGESGTGKELVARALHFGGPRTQRPFVPINCSAIPTELAESLFFGHVRGAFTSADIPRKGYFELANGGTLFLDEIGSMSIEVQAKLLRVLEDRRVMPIGATHDTQVDVQVVAATNTDLWAEVEQSAFRRDLYFRIARTHILIPPLRERKEDIPLLAQHFLSMVATEMEIDAPAISPKAVSALEAYAFPGNVRELKNMIEGALSESGGADISPKHLHFVSLPTGSSMAGTAPFQIHPIMTLNPEMKGIETRLRSSLTGEELAERGYIERVFMENQRNVTRTAQQLGMTRQTLYRRLEKYGLQREEVRLPKDFHAPSARSAKGIRASGHKPDI